MIYVNGRDDGDVCRGDGVAQTVAAQSLAVVVLGAFELGAQQLVAVVVLIFYLF